MKNRWKHSVLALALCAAMVFSFLTLGGKVAAVDVKQYSALTVQYPDTGAEDLQKAGLAVDLYKIADAKEIPGSDGYALEVSDTLYSELSDELARYGYLEAEDWKKVANTASVTALTKGGKKTVEGAAIGATMNELTSGLYLAVIHGGSEGSYYTIDGTGNLTTSAHSLAWDYSFEPQLVLLPARENVDGNHYTWSHNVTATFKYEKEARLGSLEIVKVLERYEDSVEATFVFQIEAVLNGVNVYSDVVSMVFNDAGEQKLLISDRIPVGAEVTVTEVYSGAAYSVKGSASGTAVIGAPDKDTASVSFTNDYNGEQVLGTSVTNRFNYVSGGTIGSVDQQFSNGSVSTVSNVG